MKTKVLMDPCGEIDNVFKGMSLAVSFVPAGRKKAFWRNNQPRTGFHSTCPRLEVVHSKELPVRSFPLFLPIRICRADQKTSPAVYVLQILSVLE